MSAIGYERTLCHPMNYVRFTPESGHIRGLSEMSSYDPKRTFINRLFVGIAYEAGRAPPPSPTRLNGAQKMGWAYENTVLPEAGSTKA